MSYTKIFINSREKVDSMLELCSDDVNLACQVLVEECNCRTILMLMRSKRMAKIQRRNIHINTENFLHDALSIYKDFSSFTMAWLLQAGRRALGPPSNKPRVELVFNSFKSVVKKLLLMWPFQDAWSYHSTQCDAGGTCFSLLST